MNKFMYSGSATGSFSGGGPAHPQSLSKQPQMDPVDIDYLNSAWHPTHYARAQRRREALDRMLYLARIGMQQSLYEMADMRQRGQFNMGLVERYKTMYQFTQEEINVRCTETESYVQGSSGT